MNKSIFASIFMLILSAVSNAQGTVTVLRNHKVEGDEPAQIMAILLEAQSLLFEESNFDAAFEKVQTVYEKTKARIVPAFDDGRLIGLQVFNIYPGSVFEKLGLEERDIIVAINGKIASTAPHFQTLKDTNL